VLLHRSPRNPLIWIKLHAYSEARRRLFYTRVYRSPFYFANRVSPSVDLFIHLLAHLIEDVFPLAVLLSFRDEIAELARARARMGTCLRSRALDAVSQRIKCGRAFQFTCPTCSRRVLALVRGNLFPIKPRSRGVDRSELCGRLHHGGLTLRLIC